MRNPSAATTAPRSSAAMTWLAGGLLCALPLAFIVLGHEGRRVAQLLVLMLPPVALLCIPLPNATARHVRSVLLWLWTMLFIVDGAARGYLQQTYQSAPNGALVLGAAANTNFREGSEYLLAQWRAMAIWGVAAAVAGCTTWFAARRLRHLKSLPVHGSRVLQAALLVLLVVVVLAHASKPWRRLHPVAFWSDWVASVQTLRGELSDQHLQRRTALANAKALAPHLTDALPATVVLVISDSVNRDNMSLYGYARNTTPQLQKLQRDAGPNLLLLRNAWSVEASTLPALARMFNIPVHQEAGEASSQHLLALARTAGYRVWWVSNHDDLAIDQQHAQLADVVQLINRVPGRSSESLDGELLDEVKTAIADPHERKLIVVHLLGAHPHYRLRFPQDQNPFDDHADAVEHQLIAQGRPGWLRNFRHEYDAALLYHDGVVSELLRMTQASARPAQRAAWMYLSDHGQEVGHSIDHAGHSPGTASGFRIPAILWRSEPFGQRQSEQALQPFRNDWMAFTAADLMRLQWRGQMHERDVLSPAYQWQPPMLPVAVASFAH